VAPQGKMDAGQLLVRACDLGRSALPHRASCPRTPLQPLQPLQLLQLSSARDTFRGVTPDLRPRQPALFLTGTNLICLTVGMHALPEEACRPSRAWQSTPAKRIRSHLCSCIFACIFACSCSQSSFAAMTLGRLFSLRCSTFLVWHACLPSTGKRAGRAPKQPWSCGPTVHGADAKRQRSGLSPCDRIGI